jgi:hypothetical protein
VNDPDPDLQALMEKARPVWQLFQVLQAAGFTEDQAYILLPPMIVSGALRRET